MELLHTDDHYILQEGDNSLWCSRRDGSIVAKKDLSPPCSAVCLGHVFGIIGKIQIHPEFDKKILLIRQQSLVGILPGGHRVYKINKIAVLTLTTAAPPPDIAFELCKKHHLNNRKTDRVTASASPDPQRKPLQKTWNTIKTATAHATTQVKPKKKDKELRDKNRFDKRITDELLKMYTDTDSFYYSPTGDLTNSLQRQYAQAQSPDGDLPLWKRVDDRFFWNKHMLEDLIELETSAAKHWILPIIQGYVQVEDCQLDVNELDPIMRDIGNDEKFSCEYKMIIISRRSRYRAGTRYKRRGADESGKCANYVETEQIVEYLHHCLSFVQTRGSVPVFWSQPGYKYRPPPRLDRGEDESQEAFEKHFAEELSIYKHLTIINLVEQLGREKVLSDAYLNHILSYNSPNLIYVSFDFHEYCRGMRFENVAVLITSIEDIIKTMWYCWIDKQGLICEQQGVFRVNCIDCLDRTNIVQTALAKAVLETQFTKLGLLPPEGILPASVRNTFQVMWANNGDIISRQYAGTAALKGDFTRTGERRFAGLMKDGYNSANRYYVNAFRDGYRQACLDIMQGTVPSYDDLTQPGDFIVMPLSALVPDQPLTYFNDLALSPEINLVSAVFALSRYYMNRFKDAYRQATIDLMLGNPVTDDMLGLSPDRESSSEDDAAWIACQTDHVKQLIDDCKKILVPDAEITLGGWALVDADPVSGDPAQQEMDTILILTQDSYYMAEYDDEADRIARYQRVMLEDIEKLELGPEPSIFKSRYTCFRINYRINCQPGYFHMFRSSNTRFFNNMAVPIKSEDEAIESLKAILETFAATVQAINQQVTLFQGKLERRKSKMPYCQHTRMSLNLELPSFGNMPRNVSESQLIGIKNVGSKAFSNMTSHFAKLNPMNLKLRRDRPQKVSTPTVLMSPGRSIHIGKGPEKAAFTLESSSEEEDEARTSFTAVALDKDSNTRVDGSNAQDLLLSSCGILTTGAAGGTGQGIQFVEDHFSRSPADDDTGIPSSSAMDNFSLEAVRKATEVQQQLENKSTNHLAAASAAQGLPPPATSPDNPARDRSSSIASSRPRTPEITISREESVDGLLHRDTAKHSNATTPESSTAAAATLAPECSSGTLGSGGSLNPQRKLSHSSDELGSTESPAGARKESAHGSLATEDGLPTGGMKTSHSEGAIGSQPLTLAREIMAPGFSKFAKGFQSFGANIGGLMRSPGGPTSPTSQQPPVLELNSDHFIKFREKRRNCVTRIIEL